MFKLSKKLIIAIKLGSDRQYRLAQKAGMCPTTLSKFVCGIEQPKKGDPRILRLGKILKISEEELFEEEEEEDLWHD